MTGRIGVMLAVAALAMALGPAATRAATPTPRVVGGSAVANPGWVALVLQDLGRGSTGQCDGNLIAEHWVLTAAHCVTADDGSVLAPSAFRVYVGIQHLSDANTSNAQPVDGVIRNPGYAPQRLFGDFALLHLTAADPHAPVALGSEGDPPVGSTPSVLGFGDTDSVLQQTSDSLLEVAQPVLDPATCTAAYGGSFDAASQTCAGGVRGQDSCNGDSGGPLALLPLSGAATLVGTVDYGSDTCGDGQPAVYEKVTTGADAQTIATHVPTVAIHPASTAAPNSSVNVSAGTVNLPSPSFAWDVNGDGVYGDATGAAVRVAVGSGPLSIGVRATGSDGEQAARRLTITPVVTTVTPTAPATAREGSTLRVALAKSGPGAGTVSATATGHGISVRASAAAVPGTISLKLPNDSTWRAPRHVTIALSAGDGLVLSTATLHVTVVDDDTPHLRLASVVRRTAGTVRVGLRAPGAGTVTLRAVRAGRTVARRVVHVHGTGSFAATLSLSPAARRAVARGGARLSASWRSSSTPVAKAQASRALR